MNGRRKPEGCAFKRTTMHRMMINSFLKHRQIYRISLCLLLMCALLINGCGKTYPGDGQGTDGNAELSEYTLNDFYFDTVISIRFDADEKGEELIKGCRRICDDIQRTFNRTDENSELYAVNHRETDRVEVSEPLARLVQVGLDYYEISNGRFDITIAPLSDLWDFKSENPSVPSEALIQSALRKVDARTVHVEGEGLAEQNEVPEESEQTPVQTESEMHAESEAQQESDADMIKSSQSVKTVSAIETARQDGKLLITGIKTVLETDIKAETENKTVLETDIKAETENKTVLETDIKTEAENKTESGTGVQADTEAETEAEREVETEAETEVETEAESPKSGWFLRFDSADTMIDLGALVKGYAADRLAEYLKENGVTSGLINLGGNVYALGAKADGSPWKVGIQKPFDTGVVETVEVTDKSVVSSGVYERCFEKDGVLYHHVLDPKTGYPVSNGLWGVSIICDSSLTGDALSTTCLAIGIHEAGDLIRSMDGISAIFVDDQLHVIRIE